MRLTHERLSEILDDMNDLMWGELHRLYLCQPLGRRVHGRAVRHLEHHGLATPIGRHCRAS